MASAVTAAPLKACQHTCQPINISALYFTPQHPHRQLPMARSTLYTFRDQEVVYPLPPYQHVTQCVSANYVRPLLLFLSSPHPTSRGGSGRLVDPFRPHAGRKHQKREKGPDLVADRARCPSSRPTMRHPVSLVIGHSAGVGPTLGPRPAGAAERTDDLDLLT
ncbi:unnamed protein product [Boreogadus saida]